MTLFFHKKRRIQLQNLRVNDNVDSKYRHDWRIHSAYEIEGKNRFHLSITISQLYILFSIFPVLLDFKYIFVLEIMCVLWQSNVILKRRKGLFWPKVQISCYYDKTLKNVTLKYTRNSPRTCVSVVFCPVNLLCFMITAYCPENLQT